MPGPQINPADIINWPILKITYRTDKDKVAALLPPSIDPSDQPNVRLNVYCVPVPDEPEYGVLYGVDANYKGQKGMYALGYAIDQEAAVFISRDMNGQPKYPADVTYYRMQSSVTARASHQGYTFMEFSGKVTGEVAEKRAEYTEDEWWIKVSRAVGGAEKSYDFAPHVVKVHSTYGTQHLEEVEGTLTLRDSPWDPFAQLLPQRELVSAFLDTPTFLGRDITLESPLDPDAFWPHVDTISGSRWPGSNGGPKR